ncbi:MAG: undecaprenyl-phosphate glucose phosphotransferase [candidate division KSB1 bacterium]|nr:undecaprenyl-phosphate glucose phosphotransferase [candidate division KSB1 bacterium]MDZ7301491.1 undecaprenyl-phosphate glucose phosphotransferase [candidate division KSB1 bacterium]MDZ7310893.1 undecaprenyl-phosphate glucose phosphotransferase [candidate division KSB1 bacterium]
MFKKHARLLTTVLAIGDLAITGAAFYGAFWLRVYSGWLPAIKIPRFENYLIILGLTLPLWLTLFMFFKLYTPRRSASVFADAKPLFLSIGFGVLFISAFTFFYRETSFSRLTFILFGGLNFCLLFAERVLIRTVLHIVRRRGYNFRRLLIVGAGELGMRVAHAVYLHPEMGYRIVGFLDDYLDARAFAQESGFEILGKTFTVAEIVERYRVDKVIVALPIQAIRKISNIVQICEREGVPTDIVPDFFKFIQPRTRVQNFAGLPLISARFTPVDSLAYRLGKRIFDIVFSSLALVLLSPLFLLIALGIKLTSPGPIFFAQERVGANRRPFRMLKFRTMRVSRRHDSDTIWTRPNDSRITRFGAFLRRTSLDELPQFINVLKGDMSVVGPRPERPFFAEQFKTEVPQYMVRHQVKTGITGWAQVNGWRGDTSISKRVEHDLYYIENWSFGFDLKIILKTISNGLVHKNAY